MSEKLNESPINLVIGERGAGKTLLVVGLASLLQKSGMKLISNVSFHTVPFRRMTFAQFVAEADTIRDTVAVFDEFHVGADSYKWWSQKVNVITAFLTQTRKRNVIMFLTTQRMDTIASRARKMVDYVYQVEAGQDHEGQVYCEIFDRRKPEPDDFVKAFMFDGRPFFDEYDTNEIITTGDDEIKQKNPKKAKADPVEPTLFTETTAVKPKKPKNAKSPNKECETT